MGLGAGNGSVTMDRILPFIITMHFVLFVRLNYFFAFNKIYPNILFATNTQVDVT